MDPGSDPGGGGGEGSGGPPTTITGAVAGATGFATGVGVGMVMLATCWAVLLGQQLGLPVVLASMGLAMGGGGKEYGWRWNPYGDRSHCRRWRKVYLWRV